MPFKNPTKLPSSLAPSQTKIFTCQTAYLHFSSAKLPPIPRYTTTYYTNFLRFNNATRCFLCFPLTIQTSRLSTASNNYSVLDKVSQLKPSAGGGVVAPNDFSCTKNVSRPRGNDKGRNAQCKCNDDNIFLFSKPQGPPSLPLTPFGHIARTSPVSFFFIKKCCPSDCFVIMQGLEGQRACGCSNIQSASKLFKAAITAAFLALIHRLILSGGKFSPILVDLVTFLNRDLGLRASFL